MAGQATAAAAGPIAREEAAAVAVTGRTGSAGRARVAGTALGTAAAAAAAGDIGFPPADDTRLQHGISLSASSLHEGHEANLPLL